MDQGVMGRAKSDEQLLAGDARAAVMHMHLSRTGASPADPAGAAVALEHPGPVAGEVESVMAADRIAGGAEASGCKFPGPAGAAAEGKLPCPGARWGG